MNKELGIIGAVVLFVVIALLVVRVNCYESFWGDKQVIEIETK